MYEIDWYNIRDKMKDIKGRIHNNTVDIKGRINKINW